jgi:hypothetical protein
MKVGASVIPWGSASLKVQAEPKSLSTTSDSGEDSLQTDTISRAVFTIRHNYFCPSGQQMSPGGGVTVVGVVEVVVVDVEGESVEVVGSCDVVV